MRSLRGSAKRARTGVPSAPDYWRAGIAGPVPKRNAGRREERPPAARVVYAEFWNARPRILR